MNCPANTNQFRFKTLNKSTVEESFDRTEVNSPGIAIIMQPDQSRRTLGKLFTYMTWIIILGLLFLFFQQQLLERNDPNHQLNAQQLTPLEPVVLTRNSKGHYVAPGLINGNEVRFLLDTGATDISIPSPIAKRIGLTKGRPVQAFTANGLITVYETTLKQVTLGGITLYDVKASINPHMRGDTALLGMSFMQHLEMIQRGETLTLKVIQ